MHVILRFADSPIRRFADSLFRWLAYFPRRRHVLAYFIQA